MKKTRPASKSSAPKSESVRRKKSRFWNIASDFDGALALHENPRARKQISSVSKSEEIDKLMLPSDKAPYCISVSRRNTMVLHGHGTRRATAPLLPRGI